ncbi:MAG: hypothetical protein ACI3XI_08960 [Eubacteriales bacterium]
MTALLTILGPLMMTLLLEVPLGVLILKNRQAFVPLCLINILTNPVLNAVLLILFSLTQSYPIYYTALVLGELVVFIGESFLLRLTLGLPLKRALMLSTVLNSVSLFLGSAILSLL